MKKLKSKFGTAFFALVMAFGIVSMPVLDGTSEAQAMNAQKLDDEPIAPECTWTAGSNYGIMCVGTNEWCEIDCQ